MYYTTYNITIMINDKIETVKVLALSKEHAMEKVMNRIKGD